MLNKKVLLRECKRHTARHVANTPFCCPNWGGGTPSQVQMGYPISDWGTPCPDLGWGTPLWTWLGYLHLDLARVPPIWTWPGYPPHPHLAGVPPPHLDLAGVPPIHTWLEYSSPSRPGWGTPPPPSLWTDRWMDRHVSKHYLPVVLRTRAVIIAGSFTVGLVIERGDP